MVQYDHRTDSDPALAALASSAAPQRSSAAGGRPITSSGRADPELARRFEALAAQWREDTEFDSAPMSLFQHPAYLEIIGLGPAVLPLMFADLAAHGSFWFGALRGLTGEDPVPPEDRGRIARMREHWRVWGRARGFLDG